MSHNMEADFAGSELARMFAASPDRYLAGEDVPQSLSASASYEPSSSPWPKSDGVLTLVGPSTSAAKSVALEYKRPNEGVHGLLTAMGQAYSYLHKGYNGVAIVVPRAYSTHAQPGAFLKSALDFVDGSGAIGVFDYEAPDVTLSTPFAGRLRCVRSIRLETRQAPQALSSAPKTQWVHMREGSTTRDGFYRFLQTAKILAVDERAGYADLAPELMQAVERLAPGRDPHAYLANVADERLLSKVWVKFWFDWVATKEVLTPWLKDDHGVFKPPRAETRIRRDDDRGFSQIFEGRANGLKETLCQLLNAGRITEAQGWELFVAGVGSQYGSSKQGVRARAHSYREDLDSSLAQLDWIDEQGRPTDYGYRFASLCERYGGANAAAAHEYFGATLVQTGGYGTFLHYIYRLSEARFKMDPLAFTRDQPNGRPTFNEESYWEYLEYLEDQMTNELKVMRKVSGRARPRRRTEFQAELTLLRNYGFVSNSRYRLGVGIPIDWDKVTQARNVSL